MLSKEAHCKECYVDGAFTSVDALLEKDSSEFFTHRWHPQLAAIPPQRLLVLEAYQARVDFTATAGFEESETEIKAHLRAMATAGVPKETCLHGVIPDNVYSRFFARKSEALSALIQTHRMPKNYEHFLNIKNHLAKGHLKEIGSQKK